MRLPQLRTLNTPRRLGVMFLTAGTLCVGTSGCYTPYYYSPPMQTYQGPVAPIQTLTPGPAYVPGQTPAGGLQPIPSNGNSLGSPSNQPFYDSGSPSNPTPSTFDNTPSNSQPPYNPGQSNDNNNFVPDYLDSGQGFDPGGDFQPPDISPNNGVEQFKVPTGEPQAMISPTRVEPLGSGPVTVTPVDSPVFEIPTIEDVPAIETSNLPPFDLTIPQQTASVSNEPISQIGYSESQPASRPEPPANAYGHEEGAFGWLRGVVNKDPADGSWTITYNVNPDLFDDFAGHFTLANNPRLEGLADGDVVLIEGEVSPIENDRFGKPVYEIRSISPMNGSIR